MRRYLAYLLYVLRHKWFVAKAGWSLGLPLWMLIAHDWDKLKPSMFIAYARCFNKPDGSKQYVKSPEFVRGWKAHQAINKHHYQYWIYFHPYDVIDSVDDPDTPRCQCHDPKLGESDARTVWVRDTNIIVWDRGHAECLDCGKPFLTEAFLYTAMPDRFRREMLADWQGAGLANGTPDTKAWYIKNFYNLHLNLGTRRWIEDQLDVTQRDLEAHWAAERDV